MADEISKKVLIEIDLKNEEATAAVGNLKTQVDNLKASVVASKQSIAEAKAATAAYGAELAKGKLDQQAIKKAIDEARLAQIQANAATKEAKKNVQAAKGSYDEAQKSLTALGRAIKSAEGGFNSSNPAIQKQIEEYNKLNAQLGAFDKKLGNHQRNIGNYESALNGLNGKLGELLPGFNNLSNVLQGAAKGFNMMKEGGAAAGEGASQAGAGAAEGAAGISGMVIALAALAVGVAAIIKYFASLTPNAEGLAQRFAYLKGSVRAFLDDLGNGTGFQKLASDMKEVGQEAANLKMQMQDLSRSLSQDEIDDARADAKIADLQLKMRNRRNTPEQERAYFDQIQKISQDKYKGNIELANKEYELAVRTATNSKRFSAEEKKRLMQDGIDYAIILDKTKGLVNGEDDIKAIVAAQQKQIATERELEIVRDRAQNRLDASDMKAEAAAEKAKNDLLEAQRANEEILNLRKAAIAKMLQDEMDAFGKELSMNDEQYRQLIFKQQDFIKKQEELRNKTKSPAAKRQYTKNISDAQSLIGVYGKEHSADQEKIITDYFKKTEELVTKGQDELAQMQINNIQNVEKRQLAALDAQKQIQLDGYQKEQDQRKENIAKLQKEVGKARGDEKIALERQLEQQYQLEGINDNKRLAMLKKYENDRQQIIKEASDKEMEQLDQIAVLRAQQADKNGSQKNDKSLLDAQQKALLDKYNADVSQKGKTDAEKLLLEQEYLNAQAALNDQYRVKEFDKVIQWEQLVQNTAANIIKNSISSNAQAAQVALEKQKTHELNNQALTSTQKEIINEKYRVKEGQAKVKEFKANQKLQEANALINGAVAITKTFAELGWPAGIVGSAFILAETAAQEATIASQKPPAYALGTGPVHIGNGKVSGPGSGTSDSINARLSNGESVINAKSTSMFGPLLSAINQIGGGVPFDMHTSKTGFATGGVFNTYLPTGDNGMRPNGSLTARMHPDDINSLGNMIANMPPPIVDVKDVGYQQQRLSSAVDRGNY